MASSGIRRKVDDLGRVVIPAGIRRTLGIREGDPVEVTVEGERVVLAKPHDACVFCGREEEEPTDFRGRLVCRDCLASLGAVDERRRATTDATARGASTDATARGASSAPHRGADLPAWDAPTRRTAPAPTPAAAAPPAAPPVTRPAEPSANHALPEHRPAAARDTRPEPRPDRPEPRRGAAREEPGTEDTTPHGTRPGRRPPYDPASTTAW